MPRLVRKAVWSKPTANRCLSDPCTTFPGNHHDAETWFRLCRPNSAGGAFAAARHAGSGRWACAIRGRPLHALHSHTNICERKRAHKPRLRGRRRRWHPGRLGMERPKYRCNVPDRHDDIASGQAVYTTRERHRVRSTCLRNVVGQGAGHAPSRPTIHLERLGEVPGARHRVARRWRCMEVSCSGTPDRRSMATDRGQLHSGRKRPAIHGAHQHREPDRGCLDRRSQAGRRSRADS